MNEVVNEILNAFFTQTALDVAKILSLDIK